MYRGLSKVPEVTLAFWIIKIGETTLGEKGGDALSMTMNLGEQDINTAGSRFIYGRERRATEGR